MDVPTITNTPPSASPESHEQPRVEQSSGGLIRARSSSKPIEGA